MRSEERVDLIISMIDRTLDEYERARTVDETSRSADTRANED
jgi:hypothetical protein